ncbi:MAG: hypothetical protein Q8M83_03175 [bacterium]|nr:hypothetical protein [bacterium]
MQNYKSKFKIIGLVAIICGLLISFAPVWAVEPIRPVGGQYSDQKPGDDQTPAAQDEQAQAAQKEGTDFTNTFLNSAGFNVLKTSEGQDVRLYVVALIKMVLSATGFLFLILVVYGGYLWMTAAGNEETLTKAKQIISKAIVGFVVIMAAYSLTAFIGWYIGQSMINATPDQKQDFLRGLGDEVKGWDLETVNPSPK